MRWLAVGCVLGIVVDYYGINYVASGVNSINNGRGVKIVESHFPFRRVAYSYEGDGSSSMYVSRPSRRQPDIFLYDENGDDIVDKVSSDDFHYTRGMAQTEELFRRADNNWKYYTTKLKVKDRVAEELAKPLPKPEELIPLPGTR